MELFKVHPCESEEERLVKQGKNVILDEQNEEQLDVNPQLDMSTQLESLIQQSLRECYSQNQLLNNKTGTDDTTVASEGDSNQATGEIIIYVTQEGVGQPTEVHIKPVSLFSGRNSSKTSTNNNNNNNDNDETSKKTQNSQHSDSSGIDNDDMDASDDITTIADDFVNSDTPFFRNSFSDICKQDQSNNTNGNHILNTDNCVFSTTSGGESVNNQIGFVTSTLSSDSRTTDIVPKDESKIDEAFAVLSAGNETNSDFVLRNLQEDMVDPLALPDEVKITVNPLLIKTSLTGDENVNVPTLIKQEFQSDQSVSPTKKKGRLYKCPECCKTFSKNSNYRQHLGKLIHKEKMCVI